MAGYFVEIAEKPRKIVAKVWTKINKWKIEEKKMGNSRTKNWRKNLKKQGENFKLTGNLKKIAGNI